MSELHQVDYQSPIGVVEITGKAEGIISIFFSEQDTVTHPLQPDTPQVLQDCLREIEEYFKAERIEFTIPYITEGTEFQKRVWSALTEIPYAETVSYRDIAIAVGSEKAVRAVGNANSKNKISIIVPCHRIIGSNGRLTGYAGGLSRKEWLIQHEKSFKKI